MSCSHGKWQDNTGKVVLSEKEKEILTLLSMGFKRVDVAIALNKSIGTIDKQINMIIRKYGSKNVVEAISIALRSRDIE